MSFLDNILGGSQHHQDIQDFVNRYQQGSPSEGYSDQEVQDRYRQVASQLPPDDYQQAARAAFERMSPQEREEFARYVEQNAQQRGLNLPGMGQGSGYQQYQDPGALAQMTSRVQQEDPDLLSQLFGQGGALGNPVMKAGLAGIAAMAASRFLGGRR